MASPTRSQVSQEIAGTKRRPSASPESAAVSTVQSTVPIAGGGVESSQRLSSSFPPKRVTSFLENGARDILPPSEFGFPVPKQGQSLADFLMFSDFKTNMSPLDKENAHFSIAEALIQAIEYFNFHRGRPTNRTNDITSESELECRSDQSHMRQRRRLRDRRKLLSPITSPTTDYSSSCVSQESSERIPNSTEADETCSQSSYDSEDSQDLTAEGVALCLLRNFKDKPLPKASDLVWMVNDGDTNQKLLPLPDSLPVSPEDAVQVHRRGTDNWAPPRRHIIYNVIFREGNVKGALTKQGFRCAGCATKVDPSSRLRLCHYLGKYFCQVCHQNAKSLIPARIALRWDFTLYPVSNFARELLRSLESDPVFDLCDYSKNIFTKSGQLEKISRIRLALIMVAQYVLKCKNANKNRLLRIADYYYKDQFKFSLNDLVETRSGELHRELLITYDRCVRHVTTCQLCNAQAFICEKCNSDVPIFPFDINNVLQCGSCRSCFHKSCVKGAFICDKCHRREKRNCETIQEAEEASGV